MSPKGLRPEKDCAGEAQQKLKKLQTRPVVREGAQHLETRNCLKIIKKIGCES
jgi:hypothetical protein